MQQKSSYFVKPFSKVAVLLTCHNRVEKTLKCLSKLFGQQVDESVKVTVYLVDDGSTDGTGIAVKDRYPDINVIYGDGSLFWNGGMHQAFAEALKVGFDYYLWLNDDTNLSFLLGLVRYKNNENKKSLRFFYLPWELKWGNSTSHKE